LQLRCSSLHFKLWASFHKVFAIFAFAIRGVSAPMRTKSLSFRPGCGWLVFGRHQMMASLPPWRMLAAGRDALLDATMMFSRAAKERFDIRSPVGCPSLRGLTLPLSLRLCRSE
jgi:hypothetical protein